MKKGKIGIKLMMVAIILTVPGTAFAMDTGNVLPKDEAPVIEASATEEEKGKEEEAVSLEGTAPLGESPLVEQKEETLPGSLEEDPKAEGSEPEIEGEKEEGGIIEEIIKPVIEKITEVIEEAVEGIRGEGEETNTEETVKEEEPPSEETLEISEEILQIEEEEGKLIIKHVLYLEDGELEFTEELTGLEVGEVIDLSKYEQRSANYYCKNENKEVEIEAGTQEVLMEYAFRSTR